MLFVIILVTYNHSESLQTSGPILVDYVAALFLWQLQRRHIELGVAITKPLMSFQMVR